MRQQKLALTIAILALATVAVNAAFKKRPTTAEIEQASTTFRQAGEWQGKTAPDFEIESLGGERFHLADHVGQEVVILNFFATWCGPCRSEMPELSRFAAERKADPILLLGIDDRERHDLVTAFVEQVHVGFPVAVDDSGEVVKRFGVESYPTTVLIGADGRIQLYQTGAITNSDVAFGPFVGANVPLLRAGQGITADAYAENRAAETYPFEHPDPSAVSALAGRARSIATEMDCPCGCDRKVAVCGCNTAKKIIGRLASMDIEGRSDADVARELDGESCVKGGD